MVVSNGVANDPDMVKRVVSAVLWFIVVAWGFNYLSLVTGIPSLIGPLVGGALAVAVVANPRHIFWRERVAASVGPSPNAARPVGAAAVVEV